MRALLCAIATVASLAGSGGAQAVEASKIAEITKAADGFVALAAGSAQSGRPPRQTDPAAKPLMDRVLDTAELQRGAINPMSALGRINGWNLAVLKIGLVYILAGTGVTDLAALPNTPEIMERIGRNTVEFAPEMGRYMDAQLRLQAAIADTVGNFVATAKPAEFDKPNVKNGLASIRSGIARTVHGVVTTLPTEGLTDAWRAERLPALLAIGPKLPRLVAAEDLAALRDVSAEVSGQMTDPAVKAGLASFGATLGPN